MSSYTDNDSYQKDPEKYLRKIYDAGVKAWQDRKELYEENYAFSLDLDPTIEEAVPSDEIAPSLPILSAVKQIRLSAIEGLMQQAERPFTLEPFYPPPEALKPEFEKKIDRNYARLDFAMQATNFRQKTRDWFDNAETFPEAWVKCLVAEIKRERPVETINPETGQPEMKMELATVYVGPDFEVLQPEQIIRDPNARSTDIFQCDFIGFRDFLPVDYILAKFPQAADGTELTREMLTGELTENTGKTEMDEAVGMDFTEKEKGIERVEMWFRVFDEQERRARIRWCIFLPKIGESGSNQKLLRLTDDWTPLVGELAEFYPAISITAHRIAGKIEGRSTVDVGKTLKVEADDLTRMALLALAYAVNQKEITTPGNVLNNEERVAQPGERVVVKRMDDFRIDQTFNPNIQHLNDQMKQLHEFILNACAADAAMPATSLQGQPDETATLTARREQLFNSRIGRTYDNYMDGYCRLIAFYYHVIKQLYLEGRQEYFEQRMFGGLPRPEFTPDDLALDVEIKKVPYLSIAQRDIDKLIAKETFGVVFPLLSLPLNSSELMLVEDFLRKQGHPEKWIAELLLPLKEMQAAVSAMDQLAGGGGNGIRQQTGIQKPGGNGANRTAAGARGVGGRAPTVPTGR